MYKTISSILIAMCALTSRSHAHLTIASDQFSTNADEWFVSASLTKLASSWAAWHILGPNFTFSTELKVCAPDHYHINMTYDPTFTDKNLVKLLKQTSAYPYKLTIEPVKLTEAFHPEWMIEDSSASYNHQLAPWPIHDSQSAITLDQIKALDHKIYEISIASEPKHCQSVAYQRSLPIKQLMRQGLLYSHNTTFDALWLASAERIQAHSTTTWRSARDIVVQWVEKNYPGYFHGIKISDGSGLSRKNNMTGQGLLRLLKRIQKESDFFEWLISSLPQAGRSGTLINRFQELEHYPIIAKTGGMTGVHNLAGWVKLPNKSIPFVIMEYNADQFTEDPILQQHINTIIHNHDLNDQPSM